MVDGDVVIVAYTLQKSPRLASPTHYRAAFAVSSVEAASHHQRHSLLHSDGSSVVSSTRHISFSSHHRHPSYSVSLHPRALGHPIQPVSSLVW